MPASRRQYATAWRGMAASWRLRVKRSSCAAATSSPSRSRAAAESWYRQEMPRMFTRFPLPYLGFIRGSEQSLRALDVRLRGRVGVAPGARGPLEAALRQQVAARRGCDHGHRPHHEHVDEADDEDRLDLTEVRGELQPAPIEPAAHPARAGYRIPPGSHDRRHVSRRLEIRPQWVAPRNGKGAAGHFGR